MNISLSSLSSSLEAYLLRSEQVNVEEVATAFNTADADARDTRTGIHVNLSPLAQGIASASEKAGSTQEAKNAKIDESDFPKEIKELLKRIVEYREKLKEKELELEDVMRDQSLNDEQRQTKLDALQQEISSLNNSLQEAMGQLNKLVAQMDLNDGAVTEMVSLAMS